MEKKVEESKKVKMFDRFIDDLKELVMTVCHLFSPSQIFICQKNKT